MEATGLDQRMKLGKLLAEKALVVECGLGENASERQAAAVALARAIGKEQGVEFEKGAAEDLAEFVAADLMRLKTEIDKLATYAAEKKAIGRADVSALVISEKTTTVWELADMLAARWRRAAADARRDGVDVPQTDRSERSEGSYQWLAGGPRARNAAGTG